MKKVNGSVFIFEFVSQFETERNVLRESEKKKKIKAAERKVLVKKKMSFLDGASVKNTN